MEHTFRTFTLPVSLISVKIWLLLNFSHGSGREIVRFRYKYVSYKQYFHFSIPIFQLGEFFGIKGKRGRHRLRMRCVRNTSSCVC